MPARLRGSGHKGARFLIGALLIGLAGFLFACAPRGPEIQAPVVDSETFRVEQNIPYCGIFDEERVAGIGFPLGEQNGAALLFFHGGFWSGGDYRYIWNSSLAQQLMERGYTLFAFSHRYAPEHRMPTMIEDARCAARFVRERAERYGVHPNRIGAFGYSSGGHLAAMLGVLPCRSIFDDELYGETCGNVQAVATIAAPFALDEELLRHGALNRLIANRVLPEDPDYDLDLLAPLNHVTPDDAPFLLIHGDGDRVVPLSQPQRMHSTLSASGVASRLLIQEDSSHAEAPEPERERAREAFFAWFDYWLLGLEPNAEERLEAE